MEPICASATVSIASTCCNNLQSSRVYLHACCLEAFATSLEGAGCNSRCKASVEAPGVSSVTPAAKLLVDNTTATGQNMVFPTHQEKGLRPEKKSGKGPSPVGALSTSK